MVKAFSCTALPLPYAVRAGFASGSLASDRFPPACWSSRPNSGRTEPDVVVPVVADARAATGGAHIARVAVP